MWRSLSPDNVLSIRGEKKVEREERDKDKKCCLSGRSFGSFRRAVPLPAEIDEGGSNFKNGVLSVRLPKSPQARPRRGALRSRAPDPAAGRRRSAGPGGRRTLLNRDAV
jgi:Hsp20/alpha crystallin family